MDPATLLTLSSAAQGGKGSVPSALPQNVDFSSSATSSNRSSNTFTSGDFNFKSPSSTTALLIGAGLLVVFMLLKK